MIESVDDLAGFFDIGEFASLAVYTPVTDAPLPAFAVVHMVTREPEAPDIHRFLIRQADVAEPLVGDFLLLDGAGYMIAAQPERIAQNGAWSCLAIPLDTQLQFQRATIDGEDGFGQPQRSWSALFALWAGVTFAPGSEGRSLDAESGSAHATFNIARTADSETLSVTDRFLFDGSVWDIDSIVPSRQFGRAALDILATRAAR